MDVKAIAFQIAAVIVGLYVYDKLTTVTAVKAS
jgi:hypothetical protein